MSLASRLFLVVSLLLGCPAPGHTQTPVAFRPVPTRLGTDERRGFLAVEPRRPAAMAAARRTHWADGAIAGAILTGILGGYAAHGLCAMSDEAHKNCTGALLGGAAVGALVGGTIGGLIGGLFPRR